MSYDNFSLETFDAGPPIQRRLPVLYISQTSSSAVSDVEKARLYWTTQPGQQSDVLISHDLKQWAPLLNNGAPVSVTTNQGTLAWREVDVPAEYRDRAFFRLSDGGSNAAAATPSALKTTTLQLSATSVSTATAEQGKARPLSRHRARKSAAKRHAHRLHASGTKTHRVASIRERAISPVVFPQPSPTPISVDQEGD